MAEIFDFGFQKYRLKLSGVYNQSGLFAVVGDTARRVEVQLLDAAGRVTDTTGIELSLSTAVGQSSSYVDADLIDASKGLYQVDLTNGLFLKPGKQDFQWKIYKDGKQINSVISRWYIDKNVAEGGNQSFNFYLNADDLKRKIEELEVKQNELEVKQDEIKVIQLDMEVENAAMISETESMQQELRDIQQDFVDDIVESEALRISVEQSLEERYSNLEADYAQDLSELKQNDAGLTAQLAQTAANVKSFGAKGDGVTDDTQAIQSAIEYLKNKGGGNLFFPAGTYLVDFVLKVDFDIKITGVGSQQSIIKVKDNSTLFHNPTRTDNNEDYDLSSLFRDFHAVFFFVDSNFTIDGIQIDGNAYNQIDVVNGEDWNVVQPTAGVVNYYKYFHGIQAIYKDNTNPEIAIKNSHIHSCPWNNVVIGNNNPMTVVAKKVVFTNNVFGSSPRDSLSIHRMQNVTVENNTFLNPITHSLHIYYNVKNSLIVNNLFMLDTHIKPIMPLGLTAFKDFITLGQGDYLNNVIEETMIKDNMFVNTNNDLFNTIRAINVTKNNKSVTITGNKIKNLNDGFNFSFPTIDITRIENNEITYHATGLALRPFRSSTGEAGKNDAIVSKPYAVNMQIKNNAIKHVSDPTNNMSISLYTYGDSSTDEISEYKLVMIGNELSGSRILTNNLTNVIGDFKYSGFISHKRWSISAQVIEPHQVRKVPVSSAAFSLGSSVIAHPEFELPENISFSCYIVESGVCQLLLTNPSTVSTTVPGGPWVFKVIDTQGDIA